MQTISVDELLAAVKFDDAGLVAAIVQSDETRQVLMMAWMNRAAIEETLRTGRVCYWSRSRQSYWRKGESSGQVQTLKSMRFDCDGDTILLLVDQQGAACHTGRRNCFYNEVHGDRVEVISAPLISPEELYGKQ